VETIFVGYVPSDQHVGQALVTALQKTGAQVWDDAAMQRAPDIKQATVFQACHQFVVVLSREALASPQLRSQVLHYVTLHHWSADYQVTLVVRDQLTTRDLWLFVRHFPRIEQGDLAEPALVEQVVQAIATTSHRKPSTRLNSLLQQAGLVQEALATPPRYRRLWARTWRLQILAAATLLLFVFALLVSSTLLVKRAITENQPIAISNTATPALPPNPTPTADLRPIFQATSTPTADPSPAPHATVTPTPAGVNQTPTPTSPATPTLAAAPKLGLPVNNIGISNDNTATAANYDSVGFSYSAQTLQSAGFTPGATITINGIPFSWPQTGDGIADNVIANGQVIPLATSATTIAFLGSSTEGPSSGTGTFTYTDGSTQPFTLAFSDWALGGGSNTLLANNTIVATLPYRNFSQQGRENLTVYVFYTALALQPGKTLASVTLPSNSGPGALHILAIGVR
jgi:hypothetical protein